MHTNSMEGSVAPRVLSGTSSEQHDQDWSQWMQWDWDDASSNPISKSDIDLSDHSPKLNLAAVPAIGNIDFTSDSLSAGTGARKFGETFSGPQYEGQRHQVSLARRRTGGGAKGSSANNLSGRKRKNSNEGDNGFAGADDDDDLHPDTKLQPSKKRSHNVIEKRYRANLNEKITELRDSIPSLRILSKDSNGSAHDDDVSSGSKLNKASILSKATEHIRHLELRNSRLEEENKALKTKLRQLDKAVIVEQSTSTSIGSASTPGSYSGTVDSFESPPSVFSHTDESISSRKPSGYGGAAPEGMIKVPDYIKKMRAKPPVQGAFAESYIKDDPQPQQQDGQVRRGMTTGSKLFLGTIAGLMVLQNVSTKDDSESTEKGLLAVPINILNDFITANHRLARTAFIFLNQYSDTWRAWQFQALLHLFLTSLLVVGSAFVVFLYLFYTRSKSANSTQKVASASEVRMTPAQIKRQAWLTSMQRLGVPQHRFFLEWFAVTRRWIEYSFVCLLGRKLCSWITGTTEEDEKGRVKTWDIAIDAQLSGGDAEINKSRLVLTIFASGTLPRSPLRTMMKALHCRVLLWRVGRQGSFISKLANDIGRVLATYQWNLARKLNKSLPKNHPDALPNHLSTLVELECNDVLLDPIVQRAANLTWGRPTQEGLDEDEALLDVVADDPAVQTFTDSIAAWWSSHLLQNVLLHSFKVKTDSLYATKFYEKQINLAVEVAPRLSAAHTRAASMRAVLVEQNRLQDINSVLTALPPKKQQSSQVPNFLDSSIPVSVRNELAIAVRCAMIAAIIKARTTNDTSFPSHLTIRKAINWLNQLPLDPLELTLISFAAVYHLLHIVIAYGDLLSSSSASSPSATSSDFSVSTTKSAPSSLPKNESSESPSPSLHSSSSSAQTMTHKRVRSNSASEPTPQYSRIAGDLMYWARNAYNPVFYGLTTTMIETVELECLSICKDMGIDLVAHDPKLLQSSVRKLIKEERKQKQQQNQYQHQQPSHLKEVSISSSNSEARNEVSENEGNNRRKSVESNDTGYASDSR